MSEDASEQNATAGALRGFVARAEPSPARAPPRLCVACGAPAEGYDAERGRPTCRECSKPSSDSKPRWRVRWWNGDTELFTEWCGDFATVEDLYHQLRTNGIGSDFTIERREGVQPGGGDA